MSTKSTPRGLSADDLFIALNQPFDPSDIKWKPQTVDYKKKLALAVAHADPRAYIDRLNEVVGADGWEKSLSFTVTPFTKFIKGRKAYGQNPATEDKLVPGNKVLCVCTVYVEGIGSHTSSGDADASDENAATSAEAQAFKRACMEFGLGRYLYDLPKQMVPYDLDQGGFINTPDLPDWAIPKIHCEDCKEVIAASTFNDKEYSATALINNAVKKYNAKLCMNCQQTRAKAVAAPAGERFAKASK